jgi:uncharacterized membrane protein
MASADSDGWRIRQVKRNGRQTLRRNFAICFCACVIFAFFSYNPSTLSDDVNALTTTLQAIAEEAQGTPLATAIDGAITFASNIKETTSIGSDSSAGVISTVYTQVRSAGSVHGAVLELINSGLLGNRLSQTVVFGIGLLFSLFVMLFVREILQIGACRLFLENRIYPKTPFSRLFFVYQMRRVFASVGVVLIKYVFLFLWTLTIVGLPIKYYSYYLVPFIQAENPGAPPRAVLKLSENMMRGQRFRIFLFDLSFVGWYILAVLTLGLSNYLWLNPYLMAARAELYAQLRTSAKQRALAGTELLKDAALFTPYVGPVPASLEEDADKEWGLGPVEGRVPAAVCARASAVGVVGEQALDAEGAWAFEKDVYPFALYHTLAARVRLWVPVTAREHYTVLNLVLMFFLFSFIGWVWECGIAFIESGGFINRGTLYGPWIPIYGFGGVAIVVVLNRLSERPLLCFFIAVALCGVIEYLAATLIWDMYHIKYWDYSGFFFNIQGRVCLEGLFAFGVLGMVGLYVLAPMADELFLRIPLNTRKVLCIVLLALFGADAVANLIHPRTGTGITTTLTK